MKMGTGIAASPHFVGSVVRRSTLRLPGLSPGPASRAALFPKVWRVAGRAVVSGPAGGSLLAQVLPGRVLGFGCPVVSFPAVSFPLRVRAFRARFASALWSFPDPPFPAGRVPATPRTSHGPPSRQSPKCCRRPVDNEDNGDKSALSVHAVADASWLPDSHEATDQPECCHAPRFLDRPSPAD